ncbi:UNVERIFIED_CONTAM: hypothetical protein NCL1_08446 [Trichonephila clavipes]
MTASEGIRVGMTLQLDVTSEPGSFSTHQVLPTTRSVLSPVPPNYVLTPLAYGTAENAPPPNTLRDTAVLQPQAPLTYQSTTSVKYSIEGPIVSEVARDVENPVSNTNQNKGESSAPMETTNVEINRILARIEQDNRILAELEKSRATVDLPLVPASANPTRDEMSSRERNLSLPSNLPLVPASTNPTRDEMSSRERNLSLPSNLERAISFRCKLVFPEVLSSSNLDSIMD